MENAQFDTRYRQGAFEYDQFLTLWKYPDPGIPIYKQAQKAECAKLQ
jgi:hypothetical protein